MGLRSADRGMLTHRTIGYFALVGALSAMEAFGRLPQGNRDHSPVLVCVAADVGRRPDPAYRALFHPSLRLPSRHDLPLILSIGVLMLAFYTTLMHIALIYVEAGRAALLGYTTPLWVMPAAYLLFGEKPSGRKLIGMIIAMIGLVILFSPGAFDWSDGDVVLGNALLMVCALLWSVTIIHIRAYRPVLTPIQLAPFQLMISASFIGVLALH